MTRNETRFQVAMASAHGRTTFVHVVAKTAEAAILAAKADPSNAVYSIFQARVSRYQ